MRYRKLSPTGDYVFGNGTADFLVDSPATVQQIVETELQLFLGEWFLNTGYGVPWLTEIVGREDSITYDQEIKNYILNLQGVSSIVQYQSSLNQSRELSIQAEITSVFSSTVIKINVTGGATN